MFAIAALIGLVVLYRIAQRFDPTAQMPPGYRDAGLGDVGIRMGPSNIAFRHDGRNVWIIHADRIDLRHQPGGDFDALKSADFNGITNGTLFREGKKDAGFSAKTATYDQNSQRFDVRGDIRIHTVHGDTLSSEEMIWTDKDEFVRFPGGAKGEFGKNRVSAPLLLFAPKKRIIQCPQGAYGIFEGHPLTASELFWDIGKKRVDLPGTVSGERKNLQFTARNAVLDLKTHKLSGNEGQFHIRIQGESDDLEGLR